MASPQQPDKRTLIANAVLAGAGPDDLAAHLESAGVSAASARYEAEKAVRDPLFIAAWRLANRVAKRDWNLDIYHRLAETMDRDSEVPVVHNIAQDAFFRDFYAANRAVKLTGLIDHWDAPARWTLDYLDSVVGEARIELQGQRNSAPDYEQAKDRHKRLIALKEVTKLLRQIDATNDFYVTAYNDTVNKAALAPLWADMKGISLLRPSGGNDGFFWMGPKGTLTPFHHDLTNNLLVQIMGRKRVHLIPAFEVARMNNHTHCFAGRSLDDLLGDPDIAAVMQCCDIGPGEAIFLPVGWWHHVEGLDMTISMSFTNFARPNDFFSNYPKDGSF